MANKPYKLTKIDPRFAEILNEVSLDRIKNGMEKKQIGMREITRMATNAPALKDLLHQLKTEPRRKI